MTSFLLVPKEDLYLFWELIKLYMKKIAKRKEFKSDINMPIIPQLQQFDPNQNVTFTALSVLRSPEDIKKFFSEMTEIHRQQKPNHPDPRESVRADLAYVCGYDSSWKNSWNRFEAVLKDQFNEAQNLINKSKINS